MPAHHGPSVLVSGIHSQMGEFIGSMFMGHGWFVVGTDESGHTSHFARAHVRADLGDLHSLADAVRQASRLGNGLDCLVTTDAVPVFAPGGGEFVRAAFDEALARMHGSLVNLLIAEGSEILDEAFVRRRTAEFAALNPGGRVNTIAPSLRSTGKGYGGTDADAFLATLTEHETSEHRTPTLDEIAGAVVAIATQPLSGVMLGATDIRPLLRS